VSVVQVAAFSELDAVTLYELLRLRVDVFVVEQACAYPELDGRDTDPATRHWWQQDGGRVVSCLRTLEEAAGVIRVGRVATVADRRGEGLAARLLTAALERAQGPVVASVQTRLEAWYARFGFVTVGSEFVEDGIPHLPMRRP
jgi:ElaA protein